ncbi:MAG TPA: hypothetical protein VJK29_12845, partial [Terriglobales bacterium]|nr:hypothetical protein [Terriglobales bacterium]
NPSERGLFAQIVETERYRNTFEENPQSRQADKLGTRVYRSCTKVGAVTLVRSITAQQWRESARVPALNFGYAGAERLSPVKA